MRLIAVLYVDPKGPYPRMEGVDAWDETRDARLYAGPDPVLVHPPCGPWGLLRGMCTQQDATLGPLAVTQVRRVGGILEHPVGSKLWAACGMPLPGEPADAWGGRTIRVEQVSWGHPCKKPTLLYMVGVDMEVVRATMRTGGEHTHAISSKKRRGELLAPSAAMRRRTPPAFAEWLVMLVRTVQRPTDDVVVVSNSQCSRVEVTLDGVRHSAYRFGACHQDRARALAANAAAALRQGMGSAVVLSTLNAD